MQGRSSVRTLWPPRRRPAQAQVLELGVQLPILRAQRIDRRAQLQKELVAGIEDDDRLRLDVKRERREVQRIVRLVDVRLRGRAARNHERSPAPPQRVNQQLRELGFAKWHEV